MSAATFQALVLSWVAVLAVLAPLIAGLAIVFVTQWNRIMDAMHANTKDIATNAAVTDQHEKALNGALDARMVAAARTVVAEHMAAQINAPRGALLPAPPAGGGGGSNLPGPLPAGDSSAGATG